MQTEHLFVANFTEKHNSKGIRFRPDPSFCKSHKTIKIMKTEIQILAYSAAGGNLIWHETMNDFINYEREVPPTDLEELKHAKEKAKQYPAIVNVWAEKIDIETGELIESYF